MRKLIAVLAMLLVPAAGFAAGGPAIPLEKANIDLTNEAAIQRGAKYFVNYCMGCHSNRYARYQLMTTVGLSEAQIKENLIFDGSKVGDLMTIAMPSEYGEEAFGAPAPDLTLEGRLRSEDWIYTYLKSFYSDASRPTGVNNTVFPNVGMPNILWQLEGIKEPAYKYEVHEGGHTVATFETEAEAQAMVREKGEGLKVVKVVDGFNKTTPGSLTEAEFDQVARDLTTYLAYVAEPSKLERQQLGVWVLLFLLIFTVLAYMTKKEWWKDVH